MPAIHYLIIQLYSHNTEIVITEINNKFTSILFTKDNNELLFSGSIKADCGPAEVSLYFFISTFHLRLYLRLSTDARNWKNKEN